MRSTNYSSGAVAPEDKRSRAGKGDEAMSMMQRARPYTAQPIPHNLRDEQLIGEKIKVQVFMRDSEETIDTESLEKYVGTLKAFSFDNAMIYIKIDGLDVISIPRHRKHVEIFV